MIAKSKIVPLRRDLLPSEEDDRYNPANVLGILHRKDFELWVCRSPKGTLSLKWWRWRGDLEKFFPLEDGELTFHPSDLQPLAELLVSVQNLMESKGHL